MNDFSSGDLRFIVERLIQISAKFTAMENKMLNSV